MSSTDFDQQNDENITIMEKCFKSRTYFFFYYLKMQLKERKNKEK